MILSAVNPTAATHEASCGATHEVASEALRDESGMTMPEDVPLARKSLHLQQITDANVSSTNLRLEDDNEWHEQNVI